MTKVKAIDDEPSFEQRFEQYCFKHLCRRIDDAARARGDEALFVPGFERALVGYIDIGSRIRTLYDINACIEIVMAQEGLSEEAADTFFCETIRSYMVGEGAPVFAVIYQPLLKAHRKSFRNWEAAIVRQEEGT